MLRLNHIIYPVKYMFGFFLDNVWIFAVFLGHRSLLMWSQINVAATYPLLSKPR